MSLLHELNQADAVIFDVDGTLVDSMWMWIDIDIQFLARYGYSLPPELQREISGLSYYQIALYFKDRFHLEESPQELMDTWNRMALDYYDRIIDLKPGAREILQLLKERKVPLGIATSNSRELTEAVLKNRRILDDFQVICTSKEVPNGKPAPDIYLTVARALNVSPENCLVFEDTLQGVLSAKSAGMKVIAIEDPDAVNDEKAIRREADGFIHTFLEILEEKT